MTVTFGQTVDIGHGRGRLVPAAAASVRRIDAQLGRLADVNSAWRSPTLQDSMNRAWEAYVRGVGPRPPHGRALPAKDSVHCQGTAADSDDWYIPRAGAVWRDNGWRQTAADETWHGEYFADLDNHKDAPAGGGSSSFPPPEPINLEDTMFRAKSAKTGAWYVIGEFTVTKMTEQPDALAYSKSAGTSFPLLESAEIQQMMADAKARSVAFFTALGASAHVRKLAAAVDELIAGEG